MFFKGVLQGRQLENIRITYATAGMEYGSDYPMADSGLSSTLTHVDPAVATAYEPPTLDYPSGESESTPA
jgi:hypothetical protein